jgi:hypothetical protein
MMKAWRSIFLAPTLQELEVVGGSVEVGGSVKGAEVGEDVWGISFRNIRRSG